MHQKKHVKLLLYTCDFPTVLKPSYDDIQYIPNIVLKQLFDNINSLNKKVQVVIWIMYKTGLRISDTMELKQDCLRVLNGEYWIVTDIEKTYVKGHRIPIDKQMADALAVLIHNSCENSNSDNNPDNLIFVKHFGSRKGLPYTTSWAINALNTLARKTNILDEGSNLYHFKNHSFRHTYAIKLINGGVDIFTVQDLLAHASPKMIMRYAKLLEDTKRKAFDSAVKKGVFSFDSDAALQEQDDKNIPENVLDMLWTSHKLKAVDTPYGTCLQKANGKCSFAIQPPCLTRNSGKPCKDLCVGAFEGDIPKYKILISSTKSMISSALEYNRSDMVKDNEAVLTLLEGIYSTISDGNIIYSRLERLTNKENSNGL